MRIYKIFSFIVLITLSNHCKSRELLLDPIALAVKGNDTTLYAKQSGFEDLISIIKSLSDLHISNYQRHEIVQKTICGLLSNLDPHTSYLNENEFKALMEHTSGEFGGLGIQIALDNGLIRVVNVIDDTPAYKSKLKQGDYILCINDEYINGISADEAVSLLRGKRGSKVKLKIKRKDCDPFDITLTRDIIKIQSVKTELLDDILYVRISSFDEHVAKKLKHAIKGLKSFASLKGVILDMRDNHGGLLTEACAVSDLFIAGGKIVVTKGKDPADYHEFCANSTDLLQGKPIVVLINSGTASAPEIVAGALRDNKRALIVGIRSFGKGSVQKVVKLTEKTGLKITVAMHYTPSGHCIQAEGIMPDIEVNPAYISEDKNYVVLREENLKNSLKQVGESFVENNKQKAIREENKGKSFEETEFINFLKRLFSRNTDNSSVSDEIKKKIEQLDCDKNQKVDNFEIMSRSMSLKERREKDLQLRTAFHVIEVKTKGY